MFSVQYFCWIYPRLEFIDRLSQNFPILNFAEHCPVGAVLIHVDGQIWWS